MKTFTAIVERDSDTKALVMFLEFLEHTLREKPWTSYKRICVKLIEAGR